MLPNIVQNPPAIGTYYFMVRFLLCSGLLSLGLLCPGLLCPGSQAFGQHQHSSRLTPPKVFLDKSPKIVEYQLGRLSNEQLLLIETDAKDSKFKPVFTAILLREGMDKASRIAALDGLVSLNGSNRPQQLVMGLIGLKNKDSSYAKTVRILGEILIESLTNFENGDQQLMQLIDAGGAVAEVGYAGLASNDPTSSISVAREKQQLELLFRAVPLIAKASKREPLRQLAIDQLQDNAAASELRMAAIKCLSAMPQDDAQLVQKTFAEVARSIDQPELQPDVFQTLLALSPHKSAGDAAGPLCDWIVRYAEQTLPPDRTTDSFLDAMQLVDKLLPTIDPNKSKAYRERLSRTTVRVIRIRTVEEQMRYDTPHFAVQTGSDIQIVLSNADIMPHNLVITTPGSLKEIALLSAEAGPDIGPSGQQFVARDDRVLFASSMVPAFEQERMTFKAPTVPGEYPYVCTFPGHWMRMYGVMVVVDDLDVWLQNPTTPKDPVGNNRQFVKSWTVDDFASNLDADLRGRTIEVGKRLFAEATCAQCHRAGTEVQLGNIGPDLAESLSKWKGDKNRIIREILEPSYHIDPAYAMHVVLTDSGSTVSGLLVEESEKSISLLESVQAKKPTVIERESIEAHQKSSNSLMPKGLLDQFSRDEVLEIVSFILSIQKQNL